VGKIPDHYKSNDTLFLDLTCPVANSQSLPRSICSMATRLPVELTCYITNLLPNQHAVVSCSSVCRNWLPATRHHLFRRIRVDARNVKSLIDLLKSLLCTIASQTIHIDLVIDASHTSILIVPYLERFVAVRSLTLTITRGDLSIWKEIEEKLPRGSTQFLQMDLTGVHASFEYDCELTFTVGGNANSSPTFLSRLHSLNSTINDELPEISWLLDVAQFPAITDVYLHQIQRRHLADIQAIFRARGPSILSIDLGLGSQNYSLGEGAFQ
jgi:hypothetical protein